MKNKYQEALENVNMRLYYSDCSKCFVNTKSKNENELDMAIKENCSNCNLKKDIATLQELIDKYEKLRKQKEKVVNKNIKRAYKLMKESGYFDE